MIFILGIDCLDYELVERLNLNNIKQSEYGRINVPINIKRNIPLSPEVWASFLIGENISKDFVSSSYYINAIKRVMEFLQIDLDKGLLKKIKIFSYMKLGFNSPNRFGVLKEKTFLDLTKSYEINVPFYNFDNKTFDVGYLFGTSKLSIVQAIKEINSTYEMRKGQIIDEIENINNSDVVFAFIHATDMLQHLLFTRISEVEKYYIDLDNYVSFLKRKLEKSFEDFIFIIISDHGFDFNLGTHSKYAFYSSNVNLIPKPENITDFYGIILDIVDKRNKLSSS